MLLCNNRSGLYYEATGRWGANRENAYNFGSTHAAIQFAVESGLKGVELVLAYNDPEQYVTLPLEKPSRIANALSEGVGRPFLPRQDGWFNPGS